MCEVGQALSKSLVEVGELSPTELSIWVEHLKRRRRAERQTWDHRFGTLCSTIALFKLGTNADWLPERFFASLKREEDWITDETEMKHALMAWCAGTGGTVKQKGESS